MPALIVKVLTVLLASAIAKLMLGAGLAFVTYNSISGYLEGFLMEWANFYGGLPGDMTQLLAMAGVPKALEIIGSAMMSVFTIKITDRIMGVKFTGD